MSCLAERMSPMEFDQIARGDLGLTKVSPSPAFVCNSEPVKILHSYVRVQDFSDGLDQW